MKPDKSLDYLGQETVIHYQHYYTMKQLMLSYKLPVSMLNTRDEPKVLFDKLKISHRNPPSTVASRMIDATSELIEEGIKNKRDPKF